MPTPIKDVPVPRRMLGLERDHRGYPVPFNVQRGQDGTPYFTANDHMKTLVILEKNLCPLCGQPNVKDELWFVGGPLSAFHPHGCYIDQPGHEACIAYALQVCPYLITAKYTKRLDDKQVKDADREAMLIMIDPTMIPDRPKVFVMARTDAYKITQGSHGMFSLHPVRPWLDFRVWRDGVELDTETAARIIVDIAVEFDKANPV